MDLEGLADPTDTKSCWAGVATSHILLQDFRRGQKHTDFSCPSARCCHGLSHGREHPGLPRAAINSLVQSEDQRDICAGGKGGTTDDGQGSASRVGNSVRRHIICLLSIPAVISTPHLSHQVHRHTHLFLPAWHTAEMQGSDTAFPQLHFSYPTLLK